MHTHYAALVSGITPDDALAATTALLESYGLGTDRALFDWYAVGGRWSGTLQRTHAAPEGDYSTHADAALYAPEPTPYSANMIRTRSIDLPDRPFAETLADDNRARAVATATLGITPPTFPGTYSDPQFMDEFDALVSSDWMHAAQRAWADTASGAPDDSHLSTDEAPYLVSPGLYVRYRDTFAQRHNVAGFLIESPSVFTRAPDGLDFADDNTACFTPREHAKAPWDAVATQEQMVRHLDPENTWIVSLDLHD